MPLRKVHEMTLLWFGLPGPLLMKVLTLAQLYSERQTLEVTLSRSQQSQSIAFSAFWCPLFRVFCLFWQLLRPLFFLDGGNKAPLSAFPICVRMFRLICVSAFSHYGISSDACGVRGTFRIFRISPKGSNREPLITKIRPTNFVITGLALGHWETRGEGNERRLSILRRRNYMNRSLRWQHR